MPYLWHLEAVTGVEPAYLVLQTNARPLGYTAKLDLQNFIFFDWGFFLEEAEKRQNPANQAYADLQLQQETLKMTDLNSIFIR